MRDIRGEQSVRLATATALSLIGVSILAAVWFATAGSTVSHAQGGFLIFVNSTGDGGNIVAAPNCDADPAPGDQCTLRAALEASNSSPGQDAIDFAIPSTDTGCLSSGLCIINLRSALPVISDAVELTGPGPNFAMVRRVGVNEFRIFDITTTGTVSISGLAIENGYAVPGGNPAPDGGAINRESDGSLNISNCVIRNTTGPGGEGAAISSSVVGGTNDRMTISDTMVVDNAVRGIYARLSSTNITGSTISRNGTSEAAAGILSDGWTTITNSTISNNGAYLSPGGISNRNSNAAMLVVLNSTITGNYAVEYTSACPTCYPGVGIGGLARSGSSIVVGNFMLDPAGPHFDISGHHGPTSMSFGHNVIGTSYGPLTPAAGDQLGVTPEQVKLGPLQNNGGPTDTIAVGCFGVAIDAGSGGSLANDQRGSGFPRVFGASADVGAFERQNGCAPSTLIVNTTGDGSNLTGETNCDADPAPGLQCTLRAAMELANLSPGHDIDFAIPPSEPNCNASGQCVIDLTRRLPDIMEALEINGPGASQLTVRRDTSAATYFPIFTIRAAGNFHISGLTVSGGTGTGPFQDGRSGDGQGGGIYLYAHNAIVNVTRCVIAGNGFVQPGLYGPYGGIVSGLNTAAGEFVNTLNVVDTVVRDNAGAGIRASPAGIVNVKNSTISGNDGGNNAGGVSGGTVDVTNSTVTGNSSVFTGGISGGNVAITNSTIVQNIKTGHCCAGPHAGGVSVAQATIRSSIVALNTNADTFTPPYPDVTGNFTSEGYNIIGSTFGATIGPSAGDQFGVTAAQLALGPLQDNGGPAYTMLPGPGSVAIDQGRAGSLVIDQRGLPRPYDNPLIPNALGGDGSDVGAVEVTPDNDGDGMIDPFDPDDDNDGVTDDLDAFPLDPTETGDHDSDAIGNNADPDDDNDLVDDNLDAFPFDAGESSDNDGDGVGNNADTDDDNDGVADGVDNCPLMVNQNQADFDLDGIGDTCDPQTGPPVNKDQCKNNGWRRFDFPAFSNQGQCIKYVNAH